MKALTISQPFASLIADGEKWIENRRWYTPYRGPLAIHAGKGTQYLTARELREYPSGCIVAIARLVTCARLDTIQCNATAEHLACLRIAPGTTKTWSEVARHKHAEGKWCWILDDVCKLATTIPWKGEQGLFEVPDDVLQHAKARRE